MCWTQPFADVVTAERRSATFETLIFANAVFFTESATAALGTHITAPAVLAPRATVTRHTFVNDTIMDAIVSFALTARHCHATSVWTL